MEAKKITVTVTAETLHVDCIPDLLIKVSEELQKEAQCGNLIMEDGDCVTWSTGSMNVVF